MWDEARLGNNALEMLASRQWVVMQFEHKPEMWNTKPPLLIWLQGFSMTCFGASPLSLRLPTALAVLATVLILYFWTARWLKHPLAGLAAALLLLSTPGYVVEHVAATADYDAFLTLWTTLLALHWFEYTVSGRASTARWVGVWALLAVLTKGIAGLLFAPGLLLFTIVTGTTRRLWQPAVWQAVSIVVVGGASWYALREWTAQGYLAAVWENEIYGRASSNAEMPAHTGLLWYVKVLGLRLYHWWVLPTMAGWWLGLRQPKGSVEWRLAWLVLLVPAAHLGILSLVSTKVEWYAATDYPLLVLAATLGLTLLARRLSSRFPKWLAWPALLLLVAVPYIKRVRYVAFYEGFVRRKPTAYIGNHLQQQVLTLPALHRYAFAKQRGYLPEYTFYRLALGQRYGHQVGSLEPRDIDQQVAGQVVVICGRATEAEWQQTWQVRVLLRTDSCATLQLIRPRLP
jgi:4-amino-4-deoxy-L-arabinose transferase-like glycosyltransferase